MKKKLIQILMLSVVAVSVGSFVSCKDTNEDLYNELHAQTAQALAENATLKDALEAYKLFMADQISVYQGLLRNLEAKVNTKVDQGDFDNAVSDLTDELNRQYGLLNGLIAGLEAALNDKADQTEITRLEGIIGALTTQVNNNEALLQTLLNENLVSRVAANENAIIVLRGAIADLQDQLDQANQANSNNFSDVIARLVALESEVPLISQRVDNVLGIANEAKDKAEAAQSAAQSAKSAADLAQQTADAAKELANQVKSTVEGLDEKVTQYALQASELAGKFAGLEARVSALETTVSEHTTQLTNLTGRVSTLEGQYSVLSTDVQEALRIAREALAKAQANEGEINTLKNQVASLQGKDTELDNKITALNTSITDLNTSIANLKTELEGKITGNSTEITKLWAAIAALQLAGTDTQTTIAALADRICCLETQVGILEGALAVETAASLTHFEMAKRYAEQLVAALEIRLKEYIDGKLEEYLANNPDIDLSKYVTRDELNAYLSNYATTSQLNSLSTDLNNRINNVTTDYTNKINSLDSKLVQAEAALQVALANLGQEVALHDLSIGDLKNKMQELENRLNALDGRVTNLDGKVTDLDGKISGIDGRVTTNATDIEWLKYFYNTLSNQVNGLDDKIDDVNDKLSGFISRDEFNDWLKLMEEAIKNAGNHNNEGNTYDVDLTLPSIVVEVIVNKITETLDVKIKEELEKLLKDETFISAFGATLIDKLGLLTADDIDGFVTAEDVEALIAGLKAQVEANKNTIEDHEDRISSLEKDLKDLSDKIITDKMIETLKEIFATKDDIKDFITEEQVKDLLKEYAPLSDFNELKDEFGLFKTKVSDYMTTNDAKVNEISKAVDDINDEIDGMKKDIEKLQEDVKDNAKAISDIQDEISAIKGDVSAIQAKLAELQNNLAKQVTSIIIQGTRNPMFGTFTFPINIQSNVLVAYYGMPKADGTFPTSKTGHYGERAAQALTSQEISLLKDQGLEEFEFFAAEPLLNVDGNAGKVYVTINPNTADVSGLQLSIVNTLDEEAPLRLKPIVRSEDKLQFGFSRANNGFYEAQAYVTADDVINKKNGVPLTREEIEAAFGGLKNRLAAIMKEYKTKGSIDLGELATEVYQVIRGLKMDQTGLKCTYTTSEADASGTTVDTEHTVYSQYNMAASFLNPLNLNSYKDFNFKTMLGYEDIDEVLNKMAATLKDHVDVFFKDAVNIEQIQNMLKNLTIDEVKYISMSDNYLARFEARVSKITLNGVDYKLTLPAEGAFDVMFDKNLTASGAAVTIPDAVKYDEDAVNVTKATIVLYGDINSGMNTKIIVPASGDDGVVAAYACINLDETSVSAAVNGSGVIVVTTSDGAYEVASYSGSSLTATGYAARVHVTDVVGGQATLNLPVVTEITGDLRDLIAQQKVTLENVVAELNAVLNRINNYNGIVNGWVDSFIDEYLRKYLNQINNDVVTFVNSINRRFGPFLAASDASNGFKRLSGSKEYPTTMKKDGLTFYPTTKSLELFVPLSRKHVAITNVFKGAASAQDGDADCLAKMKAVNACEDLNKVVDGIKRKISVDGMVKGYVYEVAYSVLDFEGNMSTSKYYVQIQ